MDDQFWIRLLPWRQENKAESRCAQIKFGPKLVIRREKGWGYLELLLVNRSHWTVWVEEATVVLANLNALGQFEVAPEQARHEIRQNVQADDTLSVSLAVAIYNAAGRPQGPYSCLVRTDVRYRVHDKWCSAQLETCHVEMAGLVPLRVHNARWYEKKIKQVNGPGDLTTKEQNG